MNTSEMSTVMKLLFFSFWLILAMIQPRTHDRVSTKTDSSASSRSPPKTTGAVTPATIQYTIMAGKYTTEEYIRPMR